jgi:hypothetical protein
MATNISRAIISVARLMPKAEKQVSIILNPLPGAPQGGGVNHGNPGINDYFMQLQTDKAELSSLPAHTKLMPCEYKVKFSAKPSRIQDYVQE